MQLFTALFVTGRENFFCLQSLIALNSSNNQKQLMLLCYKICPCLTGQLDCVKFERILMSGAVPVRILAIISLVRQNDAGMEHRVQIFKKVCVKFCYIFL